MIYANKPRHFIWDAVVALAFALLAILLGRTASRVLTPIGGLFVAAICLAISYAHARAAWHGASAAKPSKTHRPNRA